MEIRRFDDAQQQSAAVAEEILLLLGDKPNALLCLAAGHTSLGVFSALVQAQAAGADFTQVRVIGLDEWAGLGRGDDGSCITFMQKHLFLPLGLRAEQILFFDGRAKNLDEECQRMQHWLDENGPIDFLLLGMGMNGHLALNEPGTPFSCGIHQTRLDEVTKEVGQKNFQRQTPLEGGVTLGYAQFAAARDIVLMVNGAHKAPVVRRLVGSVPTEALPASFLKTLPRARLYLDAECASALNGGTL